MKNSIFISTNLKPNTGGGNVSRHELEALQKHTNVKAILANEKFDFPIPIKSINPLDHHLPDAPFMWDYLAEEYIDQIMSDNIDKIDYLFINGNPFGRTTEIFHANNEYLGETSGKVIVDVPAHNLKESMDEHKKMGIDYAKMYPHMVDDFLFDMQTKHILLADTIICPSKHSVDALNKLGLVEGQDIRIIPHGVNLPETVTPIPEQFRVGYAGACGIDKGVIYLVMAWNNLGYKDAVLGYAGPNKAVLDDPARGWIYKVPPQKGALYNIMGWVPDISILYNNISVYVQPSVTEGFGLEVLEAMASSRPVIVSDGVGAADLVEDGKNGFVFPSRDVSKLMELIDYFKKNPSEVTKMGANARETAKVYQWENIVKRYGELFE